MAEPTLAKAWIGLVPTLEGSQRQIEKELGDVDADEPGRKVGSKFGAAITAAVVVAGAAIVKGIADSISAASNLEQAMGGLEAVFKDAFDEMAQSAQNAAQVVGLSKTEYAELATVLGAQLKNMGVDMADVAGEADALIGLGADLAAQFGGPTSEAVAALSSLLRGERDPIERYGVSINDAAIKAKLAEMGLSGLTGEAEKAARTQATLALLMEQTADAHGAFAREADTLAGKQQRLNAEWANIRAEVGTMLMPAVVALTEAGADFTRWISAEAVPGLAEFGGWVKDNRVWLTAVVGPILAIVAAWKIYQGTLVAVAAVTKAYAAVMGGLKAIQQAYALGTYGMIAGNKTLATTLAALTGALKAKAAALALTLKAGVKQLASTVAQTAALVANRIATVASTVATKAARAAQIAATAVQWLWNAALTANPIGIIVAAIAALVAGLVYFFTQTETGKKAWAAFTDFLGVAWEWISNAISWTWENILKPVLTAIGDVVMWVWDNLIKPAWEGMKLAWDVLSAAIAYYWENVLKPAFDAIGAVILWLWENVAKPAWAAMQEGWRVLLEAIAAGRQKIAELWAKISDAFKAGVEKVKEWLQKAWDFIKEVWSYTPIGMITENWDAILKFFKEVPGKLKEFFSKVKDFITEPFKLAFNKIAEMWNNTVGKLSWTAPDWIPGIGGNTVAAPKLPMLAEGGTALASGWAIVGERGPELLHLGRGASVVPLDHPAATSFGEPSVARLSDSQIDRLINGLLLAVRTGNAQSLSALAGELSLANRQGGLV